MDDVKKVLLETLCEFHSFCEKHNLQYSLIGGTLLGAVRHKGFIPWDDDIDVVMPRKDYDRLLQLHNEFQYPIILKSPVNIPDFIMPFAKLTNEKIIVEEGTHKPIRNGVWLDIFPLDVTFESLSLQKLHFFIARNLKLMLHLKHDLHDINSFSLKGRLLSPYLRFLSKNISRRYLNSLLALNESFPTKIVTKGKSYANLYGSWGAKEVAPTAIFKPRKLYMFEGKEFWGPADYDFWLSKVYGNYMALPPHEKRISKHRIKIISHLL